MTKLVVFASMRTSCLPCVIFETFVVCAILGSSISTCTRVTALLGARHYFQDCLAWWTSSVDSCTLSTSMQSATWTSHGTCARSRGRCHQETGHRSVVHR